MTYVPPALPLLCLLILLFTTPTHSIDLTQIKPSSIKEIELQAFSKTVENALINLNLQENEVSSGNGFKFGRFQLTVENALIPVNFINFSYFGSEQC